MRALRGALERPVLFFGGKGGVGKTTLAAARALESAAEGSRTLLVSTDAAHSAGDVLGWELGSAPAPVVSGLWAMELDPGLEADRYIAGVKEAIGDSTPPRLADEVERQMDVARASPGAEEAALFDRFTRILEEPGFDRIIFDTAPSGQTLRLLSMPELMTTWLGVLIAQRRKVASLGRMWRNVAGAAAGADSGSDRVLEALEERRARFERARVILVDAERTAFVFVTVAEKLPVLETQRVIGAISGHGIPVGGIIVNQVLPRDTSDPFLLRRKEREKLILTDLETRFHNWPLAYLPLLETDPVGSEALGDLLRSLASTRDPGVPA